jgi:Ca2+/Na+ antiporter
MGENIAKPTWLRIAAAVILGGVVGGILFLVATLIIGAINNQLGMTIPINLQIAENVLSLCLLILLIGLSIAYFWWKVETTPPSEPESPDIPESEISDD